MTETELMAAVNAYASTMHGMGHVDHAAARAKLLEAIEAYAHRKAFNATHPSYQVLLAQAAVCEAYLAVSDAIVNWDRPSVGQSREKELNAAVKALRELEAKHGTS